MYPLVVDLLLHLTPVYSLDMVIHSATKIQQVRNAFKEAATIVVLTGAGISADSGVPTFRGADGLWRNFRPEDLATPEAFDDNPYLVWEWYNWRREGMADKAPNAAHHALVRLERQATSCHIITQNVDGLHTRAGSKNLLEIHGNIWKVRCTRCGAITVCMDVPIAILPTCKICRGILRPHIVWFGESLDEPTMAACTRASRNCDLFFIVGTSGVVQPAASLVSMAKAAGAFVVEVNLQTTPNSSFSDISLLGRASEMVPLLV